MLRTYQQKTIDELYQWLESNSGNPCLVLPTGSGKSHIVAAICKDALQNWPKTRIVMLTHMKELIEQNAAKLRQHWPNAPLGIYSAAIGRKEIEPITFAGIQSVRKKAKYFGRVDLCIIDECHLISHKDEGSYRTFINELKITNPLMPIVGLTASPYRLGHGLITDKPAIFDALIEPVKIEELIKEGYLAMLRSKVTLTKIDTTGVKKRGGEYIESDLQKAVDTEHYNRSIVDEIIEHAGERKSWLVFCTGVEHAEHVKQEFIKRGVICECVTGATSKPERERILRDYKSGKIRCITNVSVLTTGFDAPDTDLIAFLRPTMSPGLYLQMAGRGMRPKKHTYHCLVLDFAGIVSQHGPIVAIEPPSKTGSVGEAPTKDCPECKEILSVNCRQCPECGFEFPEREKEEPEVYLRDDDIMGLEIQEMQVQSWNWRVHVSRTSGKEMIAVDYYESDFGKRITEYFPVTHGGYAGRKAWASVLKIASQSMHSIKGNMSKCDEIVGVMNSEATKPDLIGFKREGKFYRVLERVWK